MLRSSILLVTLLLTAGAARAQADGAAGESPSTEAPDAGAESRRVLRVAVDDFEASDIDEGIARLVAESVVAEIRKLEGVSVIGMKEIRDMLDLEAEKQAMGCDSEDSCLAEVADALGVDVLVTGSLSAIGDSSVVGLRRIDQRTASVSGTFNERLPLGSGEEMLAAVGPAVELLFPDHSLRAGYTRGVSDELAKRMNPPPLPTWVFWSITGTAATVAGISAATAGWWTVATVAHVDLGQKSLQDVQSGQAVKALEQQIAISAVSFYVAAAVTTGLALSAGAAAFLTDWEGYADRE